MCHFCVYLKVDQVNWYIQDKQKRPANKRYGRCCTTCFKKQDCAYSNSPEIQFKTGSGVSHKSNANYVRLQS